MQNVFVHDFGNFKLVLDDNDPDISRQIKENGWYVDEQFDLEVFRRNLKAGNTFVDLGANVGFYTFLGRTIVGEKGRLFSFEPFPRNAELINASIRANSFDNVTLVQSAVSDRNGEAKLFLSPDASTEHSLIDLDFQYDGKRSTERNDDRAIMVRVMKLDDYFDEQSSTKIDFIKMDIEGSEYRAIEGMRKLFSRNKKITLMIEFWPNGFRKDNRDPYAFLAELVRNGFHLQLIDSLKQQAYSVSPEELKRIEEIRTKDQTKQNKVMQIWGWYTNLICVRD